MGPARKSAWFLLVCALAAALQALMAASPRPAVEDFDRLVDAGRLQLREKPGGQRVRQAFAAFHQAGLMLDAETQGDDRLFQWSWEMASLPTEQDRLDGCDHLWDVVKVGHWVGWHQHHGLWAKAFYKMALCVESPRRRDLWLDAARREADVARRYGAAPKVQARYERLYEKIVEAGRHQ